MMQIVFHLCMELEDIFLRRESSSFSYGYSYSDSKGNHNSSDTTADETNSIGHGITLGHDLCLMN